MSRTKTNLLILAGIIVGGVLGVVLGQAMPGLMAKVGLLGKLYANALFFVASLLILAGTVAGANEAWHYRQSGFFGPRLYVISSAVLSAVVFCAFVFFIGRYSLAAGGMIQAVYIFDSSFPDYLMNLIPQSTLSGVFSGQYLGWFLLALLLGAVLHQMTSRGRTIASFFSELCGGLRRVNNLLFYAAPVGALFLFAGCSALTTLSITELLNPYALLLGMIVYNTVVLPWLVQSWSRRRLEEAWDKDRAGSDQQSGGYRGRQQRHDGGRFDRGGDRNRGNRPQFNRGERGPRPDRPDRPDRPERQGRPDRPERSDRPMRQSNSPFAVSPTADTSFDPTSSPAPVVRESSAEVTSSPDESTNQRREYSGPRRDNDRRGGDRGPDRGNRDRDRRGGSGRRDDRGRGDRRGGGGGRRPYQGGGSESSESLPTELPAFAPELAAETPDNSPGSELTFGRPEMDLTPTRDDHNDSHVESRPTRSNEESSSQPSGSQNNDSQEPVYGRSRYRRPFQGSDDSGSEPASTETPTPAEPTPSEPIEFGRSRRKRFGQ